MADDLILNPLPYDPDTNPYGVKQKHIDRLFEILGSGLISPGVRLHPDDKKDIIEFLKDYNNGVDRFTPNGLDPRIWMDPGYGKPPIPEHPEDDENGVPGDLANVIPANQNTSKRMPQISENSPHQGGAILYTDPNKGGEKQPETRPVLHKAEGNIQPLPLVDPDPGLPNNDAALPPLVRLDGRTLKAPEARYPAMSYRENEHETWPDWAIERATKRYPDLPKKIEESRQLVPDSPQDLDDPDYFELPENPTFKDLYSHGKWKQKKYGQL